MTNTKPNLAVTWAGAAALALTMAACGSDAKTSGTAQGLTDSASTGTVTLTDSSAAVKSRTAAVQADGSYSVDMSGLEGPYLLRLEWTEAAVVRRHYAVSEGDGNLDVNALTDLCFRSDHDDATDLDEGDDHVQDDRDFDHSSQSGNHGIASRSRRLLVELKVVLAPLFERYGITDPRTDRAAVRLLLKDVKLTLEHRKVTVTNRATGGVIFTGRLSRLSEGTFTAANMPAGPGGGTACTDFTYSAYGDCQPSNTQTRTVLTSLPTGCTGGAPVVSQACVYVPTVTTCTGFTYSAWGTCSAAGQQSRTVSGYTPASCTGTPTATPVLTQSCTPAPVACTSYTYTAWGTCSAAGMQTRAVATASPSGCTNQTTTPPVLTQSCTPTPTCTLATAVPTCSSCHGGATSNRAAPSSHNSRPATCASCHTGITATAALNASGVCVFNYPTTGTHDDGTVQR